MVERILRMDEVAERLGVVTRTAHRWADSGKLPPKRQLGPKSVGILESELDEWLRNRPFAAGANSER